MTRSPPFPAHDQSEANSTPEQRFALKAHSEYTFLVGREFPPSVDDHLVPGPAFTRRRHRHLQDNGSLPTAFFGGLGYADEL